MPNIKSLSEQELDRFDKVSMLLSHIGVTFKLVDQSCLPSQKQLQQLIYWYTPNREKALELLEQEEERWNEHNGAAGLEGDDEDDEINGLGAVKTKKKFFSNVKQAIKTAGTKAGSIIKKATKAIVKYNPVSLAVRGGFLLAMKIDLLDMASKIYPA